MMKTLTVKQPWAELIVSGIKDIENRTWRTNFRGRVLIHTAKSVVPREDLQEYPLPALKNALGPEYNNCKDCLTGAIVGSVEITDCVMNHPSEWAEKGVWNWVLSKPFKYETPITNVCGKLSIWDYQMGKELDFPYGMLEYLLSHGGNASDTDQYAGVRQEIESSNEKDYLSKLEIMLEAAPSLAETVGNSIQFFKDNYGDSIATIMATPTKRFLYKAHELSNILKYLG